MKTLRLILTTITAAMTFNVAIADDTKTVTLDAATRDRCLEVLRAGLRNEEFWPSIHAAEALTLGGYGKEVIEFLEPKLSTEKDDQHRCGIARELVRAGKRSYTDVMLKILAGEATHGHTHAAESLYKVVEIGDGVAMRRGFQQDEDVRWKLMAAAALGRCGNPDAMTFLRNSVESQDLEVMKIAAWVLGAIGDSSDIPRLKKQLPRCEEEVLKSYVSNALAVLGDADGLKTLARNLTHSDPEVRTYAANFAGDARAVGVAETLKTNAERSASGRHVPGSAIAVLFWRVPLRMNAKIFRRSSSPPQRRILGTRKVRSLRSATDPCCVRSRSFTKVTATLPKPTSSDALRRTEDAPGPMHVCFRKILAV